MRHLAALLLAAFAVLACGASRPGAATGRLITTAPAAAPAASAPASVPFVPGALSPGAAAGAGPGHGGTFVAVAPTVPSSLAVYSASSGALERYLNPPLAGGGASAPELTDDGKLVVFEQAGGTCALSIDTVPVGGGTQQVLVRPTGRGNNVVIPASFAVSVAGSYLAYERLPCSLPYTPTVYLMNLRTGNLVSGPRAVSSGAGFGAFTDDDRAVVFAAQRLFVLELPSLRLRTYPVPRGCDYQVITTAATGLDGLLECGKRDSLSIVTISPRTFTVTRTVADLGSCVSGNSISAAGRDGSALLVETQQDCLPVGQTPRVSIVQVLSGRVVPVVSGPYGSVPLDPVW
jgi:Tol biopolymer transport system component